MFVYAEKKDHTGFFITPYDYWFNNHCLSDTHFLPSEIEKKLQKLGLYEECESVFECEERKTKKIKKFLEKNKNFKTDEEFEIFCSD